MKRFNKTWRGHTLGIVFGITVILVLSLEGGAWALNSTSTTSGDTQLQTSSPAKANETPEVIVAPTANISVDEQSLFDQLNEAKTQGNISEVQSIEGRIAVLQGKNLLMIQKSDVSASVGIAINAGSAINGTSTPKVFAPLFATQDILVAGTNLTETNPSITHDIHGNLYMAVEAIQDNKIYIYRSTDNGSTWGQWYWFWNSNGLHNPSLAIGGGDPGRNYLFMVSRAGNTIQLWRVNLTSQGADVQNIETNSQGVSAPAIVTDASEYYNGNWFGYLVYNAGGQLKFTRTIDYGGNWTTPIVLHSYNATPDAAPGIDYGSYNLYVAFEDYNLPGIRDIFVVTSPSYGSFWNPQVKLTTWGYDSIQPSVAAVKSNFTNKTAVVAYTDDFQNNHTDYDVMYAYTQDGGNTWISNNALSWSTQIEAYPVVTASDYQGRLHAVFWDNVSINYYHGDIDYASTDYTMPYALGNSITRAINHNNSAYLLPPTITTEPRKSLQNEAAIGWVDTRNIATNNLDVYFNAGYLPATQKGDVNGDGNVNIVDALFIAQYTVGLRTLTSTQIAAADVDCNGNVNIVDALFIAQHTVGLRPYFC